MELIILYSCGVVDHHFYLHFCLIKWYVCQYSCESIEYSDEKSWDHHFICIFTCIYIFERKSYIPRFMFFNIHPKALNIWMKEVFIQKKKIGWNWKLKITNFIIIILMTIFFFWGGLGGIVCIICFSWYLPYTLFGWSCFSLYYFVLWHEILGSTMGHFITLVIVKCFLPIQ